ncbi:MAG: sugar kinase [Chloroflexi bacterium]|nr:sugar kinase [Chloroflexota bacterium]
MNILVVGSVAYDSVETPKGKNDHQLGGSATYFSVSASFFTRVGVVAVVGKDFAKDDLSVLEGHGVDTSGLETDSGETFRWAGKYTDEMNAAVTIETRLNVFEHFRPRLSPDHRRAPYLFLANISPDLQHAVLDQMSARPRLIACDTMNLWIEIAKPRLLELIDKVDVLMINEAEAKQLTGEKSLVSAAAQLVKRGLQALVIKRGEYGAVVFHREFTFATPAYPLARVVDPTGAGDSFAGGFMGYLAAVDDTGGEAMRRAAVAGSVMASYTVEEFGLKRLKSLTQKEINGRFGAFVELTRFHPLGGGQGLPLVQKV